MSRGWALALAAVSGCGATADGSSPGVCDSASGHPTELVCTGLYADFATRVVAGDVKAYDPSIELWSDGAEKRRFIRLPPGTTIDTRDMDHWVFPAGTRLWKEFSVQGKRAETRYLEKEPDGTWLRTTYAWSADQSSATELTAGMSNVFGSGYDIPAQTECAICHDGAPDGVLGFEAIGLSTPQATGLTMAELVRQGLVQASGAPLSIPGPPAAVAALGWLHANCGNACHNRTEKAYARSTGLFMRLTVGDLASVEATDTYVTAVGVTSGFQPSGAEAGDPFLRIKPDDVAHSAIPYRAASREPGVQMPPIATHVPDPAGVALLDTWIEGM